MAEETKPSKTTTSSQVEIKPANPFKSVFPLAALVICYIVANLAFNYGFGNYSNFEDGKAKYDTYQEWKDGGKVGDEPEKWNAGHPINFMGTVFKGGFVIPIGITIQLFLWVFTIERFISLLQAKGKGNVDVFVKRIRNLLIKGDIEAATALCDKQHGSVGNVIKAGLRKYREVEKIDGMEKEEKKVAIQTELEEATMLELPMLERNLSILSTIAPLGVLVGLFGTVLGMIKAFSALGTGGAPNAAELSVGISEALVNTAVGILTSAIAVIFYNFFSTRIDSMTYSMDEAGYSIVHTYDVQH